MTFLTLEDETSKADAVPASRVATKAKADPEVCPISNAISDEPWTEDELTAAFQMLAEGQTLKNVAAWHGKCWKKLRSKWAFHKKQQSQADSLAASGSIVPVAEPSKTPLEKVTAAVEELAAQEKCSVCQRHFKPTPDNLDLCARCRHGA